MNIETLDLQLKIMGIPESQVSQVATHLQQAEKFVFLADPGITKGMAWLHTQLHSALDEFEAATLYKVALKNPPTPEVEYLEQGYDSCQSHRKLSKVVAEAILIGGLVYESGLMGMSLSLEAAKKYIDSSLEIDTEDVSKLAKIAQFHGAKQDFLFPGVTPSPSNQPSLADLAHLALLGKPQTTVRTLTGLGGLRSDKDWNYATDLATFVNLKVAEDKRYYPGIGIIYLLLNSEVDSLPIIRDLSMDAHAAITTFAKKLKAVQKQEYAGVSVLCSAYLPHWQELKAMQEFTTPRELEFAESFHSPSYEFSVLKFLFEQLAKGAAFSPALLSQLAVLENKLSHYWSFNSTIHLPWTAELAGLSNGLIGSVTNQLGDYCIRYGIGHKGKSIEVKEYHWGAKRSFPYGLAGKQAYELALYPKSDCFAGDRITSSLHPGHQLWDSIASSGFLKAGLERLNHE